MRKDLQKKFLEYQFNKIFRKPFIGNRDLKKANEILTKLENLKNEH